LIKEELIEIVINMEMNVVLIEYSGGDVSIEEIADENVVITISHAGYIKRTNFNGIQDSK
jgi:DNA gyrase subunit A